MDNPDRTLMYAPDWVTYAAAGSGDIAYRWHIQTDHIEWWDSDIERSLSPDWPESGHIFLSRIHPIDLPKRMEALTRHLQENGAYECDFRLRMSDQGFIWVHDRGQVIGGSNMYLLGLMRPINERKINEAIHQESILRDPVTFHLSRRRMREEIERLLLRLNIENRQSAIMAIGFANENKILDHLHKDHLLTLLGAALDDCAGPLDCIGKISDTHFALLLHHAESQDVTTLSRRLRASVAKYASDYYDNPAHLPINIATLFFQGVPNYPEKLLSMVDDALSRAYRLEQSDYIFNLAEPNLTIANARSTAQLVMQAKAEGKIHFVYQPIVSAKDHKIAFHECLIRLEDQQGMIKNAGHFVPDLELLGDMRWLDRYVLEQATKFLRNHDHYRLSINISGLTVTDPNWARILRLIMKATPDIKGRLIVEITETAAISDLEETARFIRHVRELGCQVAIDDFGAGFTSFRQLKSLCVDMVKVDGEFAKNLLDNEDHQLFFRHLVSLGRESGFSTLAEYVETKEQADFLKEIGVDYLQGFYFGQPTKLS